MSCFWDLMTERFPASTLCCNFFLANRLARYAMVSEKIASRSKCQACLAVSNIIFLYMYIYTYVPRDPRYISLYITHIYTPVFCHFVHILHISNFDIYILHRTHEIPFAGSLILRLKLHIYESCSWHVCR